MSEAFFVRIRGRVHGPIDRSKLDRLVAKGQLSRIHEISQDGRSWQPASSMPELFVVSAQDSIPVNSESVSSPGVAHSDNQPSAGNSNWSATSTLQNQFDVARDPWREGETDVNVEPAVSWYYAIDGTQQGPVPSTKLADLIRTKTVSPQDMVWTNEMPNWAEAGSVVALQPYFETNHAVAASSAGTNPYAPSSSSPLIAGGGGFEDVVNYELQQWIGPVTWVRNAAFLVGAMTIGAGALCVLGCLFLFMVSQLVIGIVNMVLGGMIIWFATTLIALKRDLVTADQTRNGESIASAIRSATPCWQTLLWNLLGAIIAFGIFFVLGFVMAATGEF